MRKGLTRVIATLLVLSLTADLSSLASMPCISKSAASLSDIRQFTEPLIQEQAVNSPLLWFHRLREANSTLWRLRRVPILPGLKAGLGAGVVVASACAYGWRGAAVTAGLFLFQNVQVEPDPRAPAVATFLREQSINFDPRFSGRVFALLKIPTREWRDVEWQEYKNLVEDARKASYWMQGWLAQSKYYESLKGHPATLISMEGIISTMEGGTGYRLTSFQGGLGVLFGEWIRAIAYLGGVTTLDPQTQAPEFMAFIPDFSSGVNTMLIDAFGYPKSGARVATRPGDLGIDFYKGKDGKPLEVRLPLSGERSVIVRYRVVSVGGMKVIMPTTDVDKNPIGSKERNIFKGLYATSQGSQERFEQEWVLSLAAAEFQKRVGIASDGPVNLIETSTVPYLIAKVRTFMEEGYTYAEALELTGSQLVYFMHTTVHAGVDYFNDTNTPIGDYIRRYFEQSPLASVRASANTVAKQIIDELRVEKTDGLSPLKFATHLAQRYGGQIAAVSPLNASKTEQFIIDEGASLPNGFQEHHVEGVSNGVDHIFWMQRQILLVMNWLAPDVKDRRPEAILDPADPRATTLANILKRRDIFDQWLKRKKTADETIDDEELWASNQVDKAIAIEA